MTAETDVRPGRAQVSPLHACSNNARAPVKFGKQAFLDIDDLIFGMGAIYLASVASIRHTKQKKRNYV